MNDHLRRACYYTNRGRLNATLFHECGDFFTASRRGGEAEFVVLAAGQNKLAGEGRETGSSCTEPWGNRQIIQAENTADAGKLGNVPEIGQDTVTDIDHGRYQSGFG